MIMGAMCGETRFNCIWDVPQGMVSFLKDRAQKRAVFSNIWHKRLVQPKLNGCNVELQALGI